MNARTQRTALLLTGAVVLGSAGYALGSQAGDGSADARDGGGARGMQKHDEHRDLSALASRLGIGESALRRALEDLRGNPSKPGGGDLGGDFAKALAGALGVSKDRVTSALDTVRAQEQQRHDATRDAFAAALAKELGIDAAKVKAALDKAKPEPPGSGSPPRDPLARLAGELGVGKDRLRAALGAVRVTRPPRPEFQSLQSDLAKALGVTTRRLEDAMSNIRQAAGKQFQARRDAFAQKLADKLSLPVQKVKDALAADPGPFGDGVHPRGPRGPNGPDGPHGPDGRGMPFPPPGPGAPGDPAP
jgi:hypothetical protein